MGGIKFETLRNYTVGSNYGIGELKLSEKGNLEKINHHASKHYAGENKVVTSGDQNEAVRTAVYNCLSNQFGTVNGKLSAAMTLANEVLTEKGNKNEILSRDEAGYIISMLENAEKNTFDYDTCKKDIMRIREIKRTGVNEANLADAKRLIRGLQVGGLFSGSSAIRDASKNYRQVRPAAASSAQVVHSFDTPTLGSTPGVGETPTGASQKALTLNDLEKPMKECANCFPFASSYERDAQGAYKKSFTVLLSMMRCRGEKFDMGRELHSFLSGLEGKFKAHMTKLWDQCKLKNTNFFTDVSIGSLYRKVFEQLANLPSDDPIFTNYTPRKFEELGENAFLENFRKDLERIFPDKVEVKKEEVKTDASVVTPPQAETKQTESLAEMRENARQRDLEKLNRESAATTKNNSQKNLNAKPVEIVDVSKRRIFVQDPSENVGKTGNAEKKEQPMAVSAWNAVGGKQRNFFDNTLVNKIGEHPSAWRDTSKELPKAGFKALVMCWLDKNSPIQTEKAKSPQEGVVNPFHVKVRDSFNPDAFGRLADAFAEAFAKKDFGATHGSEQSVGESILERYGKLTDEGPVNTALKLLIGGELKQENVDAFKADVMKSLLA